MREALKLALEALNHYEKAGLATVKTIDAITAIKEALAQPEQEPVAWITHGGKGWLRWHKSYDDNKGNVPLYTTPPKRKPLTDELLEKGRDQTFSINNPFCPCDSKTFRKVARWVEAAHGIKEKNT